MAKEEGPIGLSITPDEMVVAQALYGGDGTKKIRLASGPTPVDIFGEGVIDASSLQMAIRRFAAGQGARFSQVTVALSEPDVVTQLMRLPVMPRSETRGALQGVAEQYAVFNNEEVVVDFSVIDEVMEGGARKESILLAAAKKKTVDIWNDAIAGAGAVLLAAEPTALAILRAQYDDLNDTVATASVVIDRQRTYVNIFHGGVLRLSYTIGMGAPLARRKDKSTTDYSDGDTTDTAKTIELPKPLLAELRNALRFFQIQHTPSKCERIILLTEDSAPEELAAGLATELGVDVKVFDPLKHWSFDSNSLRLLNELNMVQVVTCIGLALWEDAGAYPLQLSFLRVPEAPPSRMKVPVVAAGLIATMVLSASIVASYTLRWDINSTKAKIYDLKPQVEAEQRIVDSLEQQRLVDLQMQEAIQAQVNKVQAESHMPWSQVVRQVSTRIPEGVWLTSVESTDRQITLRGYALRTKTVADYIQALSDSPYFQYATLTSVEKQEISNGRSVIKFGIVGRIAGG